jgi:pimeloyl-ACP methyl ester carboxylesterase
MQHKSLECRGLPTAWLDNQRPNKPVLIFIHGFPDSAECWDKQFAELDADFRIIAIQVRGVGGSVAPRGDLSRYRPEAVTLDILDILEHEGLGKASVQIVSHDLGVVHAYHLAETLGPKAVSLTIINGLTVQQLAYRLKNPIQLRKSYYIFFFQLPWLPERILGKAFFAKAHRIGGLSEENYPPHVPKEELHNALNQYRAFVRHELPKTPSKRSKLPCRTLVIWGKDDAFLVPPSFEEFRRYFANATIRILHGNHWLHRQEPATVNPLIREFLLAGS